jgi:hypothetical protein
MTFILKDRVAETTTTTGTGTLTLLGAKTGYQSFSAIGDANTCFYCIAHQTLSEWEVGIGTYTSSGTTLSRDTILASSNSGSLVSFSSGTKDVFVCSPANYGSPFIYKDATNPGVGAANETIFSSTAGNARGKGAVDLQLRRNIATQVASGAYSFAAGACATASGLESVAIGCYSFNLGPTASGNRSISIGNRGTASGDFAIAISGHNPSATTSYCVCLGGYSNTASASQATVIGGRGNLASAGCSLCGGGKNNTASTKSYCVSFGYRAVASKYGQIAQASGRFAANGDAQTSQYVLRKQTTNNTQTEMFLDGSSERITLANDTTYAYSILIVARRTDANDESATYKHEGTIDRNASAATTAIVTDTRTIISEDNAWVTTIDADTTNGSLRIQVTGENSKTINWVAFVRTVEVTG